MDPTRSGWYPQSHSEEFHSRSSGWEARGARGPPSSAPRRGNSEDNTNTHGTFIDYEDFEKLGLKTAEILSAEKVEGTDKLYKLQIKAGNEEWQIVSGIADHYTPEELVGKTIIVVSNLEQATIQGVKSKGMLLSASRKKELSLIVVDGDKVESGGKVY